MGEPTLTLCCLGTGRGATAVYEGGCSSAFAVLVDGQARLLVDIGFGVVRACCEWLGGVPDNILVTHNHSDHAAELPAVLAAESAAGRRLAVIAGARVAPRLRQHRLHELESTGRPVTNFCDLLVVEDGIALGDGLRLALLPGRHSEPSYGFLLYREDAPLLGFSGDSGFDRELYERLFRASTVVLDAREIASAEHAGFDEVSAFAVTRPNRRVFVSGYGPPAEAPTVPAPLLPGMRLSLQA